MNRDTLDTGSLVNIINHKSNGEEFLEGTARIEEHLEENDGLCSHLRCMVSFEDENPVMRNVERKRAKRSWA